MSRNLEQNSGINRERDCDPDCFIVIKKENQWRGNIEIDCIYQPSRLVDRSCLSLAVII